MPLWIASSGYSPLTETCLEEILPTARYDAAHQRVSTRSLLARDGTNTRTAQAQCALSTKPTGDRALPLAPFPSPVRRAQLFAQLKQSDRRAVLGDVDRVGGGRAPVAGHRRHVAAERDEPARARVGADVTYGHCEAGRRVGQRRVVRQREVGLRHADRQLVEADALELGDLLARGGLEEDPVATVDTRHDRLDLSLDRLVERIDRRELGRLLRGGNHGFGERRSTFAALDHGLVPLCREGAVRERDL